MKFKMVFFVKGGVLDGFVSDVEIGGGGNGLKDLSLRIGLLIGEELEKYNEENKVKLQQMEKAFQGGENAPKP